MTDSALKKEEQVLYYHLICYPKIDAILQFFSDLPNSLAAGAPVADITRACDVIKRTCMLSIEHYGPAINDPSILQRIREVVSLEILSQIGLLAYQHVIDLAMPLLEYLSHQPDQCTSNIRTLRELILDVLGSIEKSLPRRN